MLICPCKHPFTPHFYIVKPGFTGVYIIFLIFTLKHRSWVHVRTTAAVLTCIHDLVFEQKYENSQNISNENCHFYTRDGRVFVMYIQ